MQNSMSYLTTEQVTLIETFKAIALDPGFYVGALCAATGESFISGPHPSRIHASSAFNMVDMEAMGYTFNERGDIPPFGFRI